MNVSNFKKGSHRETAILLTICMAVLLATSYVALTASDDADALSDGEQFTVDGIDYKVLGAGERTVEITGYEGSPESIQGQVSYSDSEWIVVSVGESAFSGCGSLESVALADGASVGAYAFASCGSLTTVSGAMASVGANAFDGCNSLRAVECAADIGYRAFWKCSALETLVVGCQSIGSYAFASCKSLESVVVDTAGLGAGLESIGTSAFSCCSSLESVDLGTVKTIGRNAFFHCSLAEADLSSATSIGSWAFNGNCLGAVKFGQALESVDAHSFGGYVFRDADGVRISLSASNMSGKAFAGQGKVLVLA